MPVRILFRSRVPVFVPFHATHLRERFPAVLAHVRRFPRVRALVEPHAGEEMVRLGAERALVHRSLAGVASLVSFQGLGGLERLRTLRAVVRTNITVRGDVRFEVGEVAKEFVALEALEEFFPAGRLVTFEAIDTAALLAAFGAGVSSTHDVTSLSLLFQIQGTHEGFIADSARVVLRLIAVRLARL